MIPINRENVRDVIIAVLCIAAACGLFYLAGCGKSDKPSQWEINSKGEPIEVPLSVKGGGVVSPGDSGKAHYPLPARQPPLSQCLSYDGTEWVNCSPPYPPLPFSRRPPACPNKARALAVFMSDPTFPDVWRGAYLCNAREIVPGKLGGRWRYVDQKRYGYREWEQK